MKLEIAIKKNYSDFNLDIKFVVYDNTVVLFGPSGSGKSTILSIIAGLLSPDIGEIVFCGQYLFSTNKNINLMPQKRKIGYIFQDHPLFPHFTVRENIEFSAKQYPIKQKQELVDHLISEFKIQNIAYKYPRQISGGQKQKVIFAQILASKPNILLLDEPFTALDFETKVEIKDILKKFQKKFFLPTILVTHDIYEACSIAHTILFINNGHITKKEFISEL